MNKIFLSMLLCVSATALTGMENDQQLSITWNRDDVLAREDAVEITSIGGKGEQAVYTYASDDLMASCQVFDVQ